MGSPTNHPAAINAQSTLSAYVSSFAKAATWLSELFSEFHQVRREALRRMR